jgi:hypothetical protein
LIGSETNPDAFIATKMPLSKVCFCHHYAGVCKSRLEPPERIDDVKAHEPPERSDDDVKPTSPLNERDGRRKGALKKRTKEKKKKKKEERTGSVVRGRPQYVNKTQS